MSGAISSAHEVHHLGRVRETGEDRVAVQLEDLRHPVLGVLHGQPGLVGLGDHLDAECGGQVGVPHDLGHPGQHRGARLRRSKATDAEEAPLRPRRRAARA